MHESGVLQVILFCVGRVCVCIYVYLHKKTKAQKWNDGKQV